MRAPLPPRCCIGLLVHKSVAPQLTEALAKAAAAVRVGDPLEENTQMGALVSAGQQALVLGAINGAAADGATVLTGSGAPLEVAGLEGGYYVAPT